MRQRCWGYVWVFVAPFVPPDFSKIQDFMRKYDRIHDFEKVL